MEEVNNEARIIERKLDAMFPSKNLLTSRDIREYTGLSWGTVKKLFGLKRGQYIDKTVLANRMAQIIYDANQEVEDED